MQQADFFSSTDGYRIQKTLKSSVSFRGIGLHTGVKSSVNLIPAPPNHGIVFRRLDLESPADIFAHYKSVVSTRLATSIGQSENSAVRIATVEHILAAIFAMGVTNLLIEVNGPEIPILDGSAGEFMEGLFDCGVELQPFSNPILKVIRPIKVYEGGAICELLPRNRLRLTTSIDFAHPSVGPQTFALELTPQAFYDQVCTARTFGFLKDQHFLQSNNLALGASVENVLVFSEDGIVNAEGARFSDECVRHKLLDAVGDLALCGCWIEGEMLSSRGGHSIHMALLNSLRNNKENWKLLPAEPLSSPFARKAFKPYQQPVATMALEKP